MYYFDHFEGLKHRPSSACFHNSNAFRTHRRKFSSIWQKSTLGKDVNQSQQIYYNYRTMTRTPIMQKQLTPTVRVYIPLTICSDGQQFIMYSENILEKLIIWAQGLEFYISQEADQDYIQLLVWTLTFGYQFPTPVIWASFNIRSQIDLISN